MIELEAPTLPCSSCGVPLRVGPETRKASCRHCGGTTEIADDVRERARAYRVAVEKELRSMSFSEAFSQGMASGAVERVARYYEIAIIVLVGVFTVGLMAPSFGADEEIRLWAIGGFVVGLALCMGVFFISLPFAIRREMLDDEEPKAPPVPKGQVAAARATGPCSACGGQVGFAVGEANARCPWCGANVVPTEAVRARLTDLTRYHADLEQGRASRKITRDFTSGSFDRAMGAVFWVVQRMFLFVPVIVGIVIGNIVIDSAPPARKGRPSSDLESFQIAGAAVMGGGVLLTALLLAGSALIGRIRSRSGRRIALDALAARYGTRTRADGTRAALEWLDAHWAAPTPDDALVFHNSDQGKSVDRLTVALHHRGAPCLVMLADAPHVRRFDVFVAAWDRARSERAGDPTAAELRGAGLRVTLGPAGIHLWAPTSAPSFCEAGAAAWLLDRATHLRA